MGLVNAVVPAETLRSVRACSESDDDQEGVRACLEKRPPSFRGR